MSDLVSLLLAAIEAREQKARKAQGATWDLARDGEVRELGNGGTVAYVPRPEDAEFIAGNDPAAVLRRCAADRKLIGIHVRLGDLNDPGDLTYPEAADTCFTCGPGDHYSATENPEWYRFPCSTLRALAEGLGISVEEETTGE